MQNILSKPIAEKTGAILSIILIATLIGICVFFKTENEKTIQTMQSSYSRSFYELIEYMDNVESLLAKAQISNSAEYAAKNFSDIWRKADLAQNSLSQIPITHITLEKVEQFLNQLSDYSYMLSTNAIEGKSISEEEMNNIKNFYDKSKITNQTLKQIGTDFNNGSLSWNELTKDMNNNEFSQEVSNISQESFSQIEENMQDYEGLIYDGPFSEHMTSTTPLGLGEGDVDEKKALEIIYQYVPKNNIVESKYNGLVQSTIPVHSFDLKLVNGNNFYIDVTQTGGKVLWFIYDKPVVEEKIDFEKAKQNAISFLNNHGITNMKETYYTIENSMVTINFAYVQENIVCYPDLIKVKVALDDGSIIGLEAQSYYSSHHERNLVKPKISIQQAKSKINKNLEIFSEGLAVIPTDYKTELVAYEFKGRVGENEFIVYVNAETGKEEKIFMIVNSPNGVLTI